MSNIAFLGLGAMGSRMAKHLAEAGHDVVVWNRSASKAEPLVEIGAKQADSPAQAVSRADFVISMVRDDEASKVVWLDLEAGALSAMRKGAIAIESSTLTPEWGNQLSQACKETGIRFVDAPLAGSRPQAETKQLLYFVGGDQATFDAVKPILSLMGKAVHHCGETGSGAKIKLAVNALLGIQLAAAAELLGLLKKSGVDLTKAVEIIGATPVCSPAVKISAGAMVAGNYSPLFPIELAEKDFAYIESSAKDNAAQVPMTSAAHRVLKSAVERGLGNYNITSLVKLFD